MNDRIAIIGPGVMGKAILGKLIQSKNYSISSIGISGPNQEEISSIAEQFGVLGYTDNSQAIRDRDVIILAVKPQRFSMVAESLKQLNRPDSLFISIIAGVNLQNLLEKLETKRVVRAMTNTAAQIGQGITVWTQSDSVDEEQHNKAQSIFKILGEEIFVENEEYLDMATALSGTGPAYVFMFMEAMIDAGVHLGFPRRIAERLVLKTIEGSVAYYQAQDKHAAQLRNEVTSPGGTSAEALYYLEKAGFRTAISRAIWAAFERSKQLGIGLNRTVDKQ